MNSNRMNNLSAFQFKNFIENRLITSFNILLQIDQQHSTAETQVENEKLKFNTFIEAKNKSITISIQ